MSLKYEPSSEPPDLADRTPGADAKEICDALAQDKSIGPIGPIPESRKPRPETLNPNPESRILKPETRNPEPETRNTKHETRNTKHDWSEMGGGQGCRHCSSADSIMVSGGH